MKAEIITIGDELLIGQAVDTNSAWMAQRLNEAGISLHQVTSVHDDRQHILRALDEAFSRADIVLTTGGLGPTKDDITKHVLCEYFHTTLVEDPTVREHIHNLYKERPDVLNRLTATQWLVPASATILPNRVGSAPIMVFENICSPSGRSLNSSGSAAFTKLLISMPGVPYEMQVAMQEQVMPFLESKVESLTSKVRGEVVHRTILLAGIPESTLAIRIEAWEDALPKTMHLAYLPKDGTIRLRLSTYGEATAEDMDALMTRYQQLLDESDAVDADNYEVNIRKQLKLAELEKAGKLIGVVTQNIDGLHQKAGSQNVYELHGTLQRNYCLNCGKIYGPELVRDAPGIPRCSCGGIVRPDIVLYEEGLNEETIEKSIVAIMQADLLIVAGTSLTVYPAAGLINYYRGSRLVLINRDETPYDRHADLVFHESLGNIFSQL